MAQADNDAPVLVIGAGIGGLTAALALHSHGVPVEVYERRSERTVELAGTGMTIWSNATSALATLGLRDELMKVGAVIRRARHFSERDEVVFETAIADLEAPGSTPSLSIARGDLIRVLLDACATCGIPVRLNRGLVGLSDESDQVTATLADGETVRGRALVGADGTNSTVRGLVLADGPPRYYGITVWRGMSAATDAVEDGVAHMFQTRESTGLAGMAWHVGDGRVAWTIGRKSTPGGEAGAGTAKQLVSAMVDGVAGPARRWVADTADDSIIRVDLYDRPWSERWVVGRVALLGDAAHAMPTVLGQGACQAIEDGVVLAACVARQRDVPAALAEYQDRRVPRVRWVRQQVDRLARMQRLSHPVALRIRDVAARLIVPRVQPKMWRRLLEPAAGAAEPVNRA
jgi:2-polyprenyl-6-methoxyphenol hydroxylase-like FAD-dependent oxidoreductase